MIDSNLVISRAVQNLPKLFIGCWDSAKIFTLLNINYSHSCFGIAVIENKIFFQNFMLFLILRSLRLFTFPFNFSQLHRILEWQIYILNNPFNFKLPILFILVIGLRISFILYCILFDFLHNFTMRTLDFPYRTYYFILIRLFTVQLFPKLLTLCCCFQKQWTEKKQFCLQIEII